jgi:hypothetical protein
MAKILRATSLTLIPAGLLLFAATAAARLEPGFLRRSLDTEVEIEATAERVWDVLADFDAYPVWNPFIRRASGQLRDGQRIQVTIQPPGRDEFEFEPTVISAERGRELRWRGHLGIPGVFDGEHAFAIEPLGDGRVRFRHYEVMSGLLVPFLGGMLRDTERGFHEMNRALKARVEGGTAVSADAR